MILDKRTTVQLTRWRTVDGPSLVESLVAFLDLVRLRTAPSAHGILDLLVLH